MLDVALVVALVVAVVVTVAASMTFPRACNYSINILFIFNIFQHIFDSIWVHSYPERVAVRFWRDSLNYLGFLIDAILIIHLS